MFLSQFNVFSVKLFLKLCFNRYDHIKKCPSPPEEFQRIAQLFYNFLLYFRAKETKKKFKKNYKALAL